MGRNQRKGGVHLTSLEHLDANIKARKQIVYAQTYTTFPKLDPSIRDGEGHRKSNQKSASLIKSIPPTSRLLQYFEFWKEKVCDRSSLLLLLLLASTYKRLCHSNSLHQMANLLLLCIADDDIFDVDSLEKHLQSLKEIALYSYL